jgi:hypothetical protein
MSFESEVADRVVKKLQGKGSYYKATRIHIMGPGEFQIVRENLPINTLKLWIREAIKETKDVN